MLIRRILNFSKLSSYISQSPLENRLATVMDQRREDTINVEPQGLYMLLYNTGVCDKYHWGIFIATDTISGMLFHQALDGLEWKFVVEKKVVEKSKELLAALKLGVVENLDDEWIAAIKTCVRGTTVTGDFTCRTWALAALYELADGGFIGLAPSWPLMREIEEESKDLAFKAFFSNSKSVVRSEYSRP